MLYRMSYLDSDDTPTDSGICVNLLAPKPISVKHAMLNKKVIYDFSQVQNIFIQDSLPAYWPDRITVEYKDNSKLIRVILVRLRNNYN